MDKNFSGQNLNGRSFRGKNLRDADFSGCQLKSCDFTGADLTDAKFCRATMGVNGQRKFLKWIMAFMLFVAGGFLAWFLNYLFAYAANIIHNGLMGVDVRAEENDALNLIGSIYAASVGFAILAVLIYRDWQIIGWHYLVTVIAGAGAATAAATVTTAIVVTLLIALMGMQTGSAAGVGAKVGAATTITIIYILLSWYMNRHALKSEDSMLTLLHRNALAWRCWGGTQFANAWLACTDFSYADLSGARFTGAKFQRPDFTGAQNLH